MKAILILIASLLLEFCGAGADFDLGSRGIVSISVPQGWRAAGKEIPKLRGTQSAYEITIDATNKSAKCLLTFAYLTNGFPDKETVRREVLRINKQFVPESVEKAEKLRDFSLEKGYGAYCIFTDASLVGKTTPPGDYRVMGSGEVQLAENLPAVVSLFAEDENREDFKAMVKAIDSLKVKKPGQ